MIDIDFKDTIVKQTRRILPFDCNAYGFLFGGKLTAWLDELASISASKYCRQKAVTASIDELYFLQSIAMDDIIYLEACVSGSGQRSIEVFVKVIGENLLTGKQYLASISFWTFVIIDKNSQLHYQLSNQQNHILTAQYTQRVNYLRHKRKDRQTLIAQIEASLNKG